MNRSQHFPFLTWGASLITFLATEKQAKNLLKAWNTLMWPTSHSVPRDSPINIKTLNKSAFLRTTLETDHQQTPKTNLFLCELCCLPQWNNYKGRKRKRKTTDMRGFFLDMWKTHWLIALATCRIKYVNSSNYKSGKHILFANLERNVCFPGSF